MVRQCDAVNMATLDDVWNQLRNHEHIDSYMRDLLECLPDEYDPEVN